MREVFSKKIQQTTLAGLMSGGGGFLAVFGNKTPTEFITLMPEFSILTWVGIISSLVSGIWMIAHNEDIKRPKITVRRKDFNEKG